jgi:hypothetical protein
VHIYTAAAETSVCKSRNANLVARHIQNCQRWAAHPHRSSNLLQLLPMHFCSQGRNQATVRIQPQIRMEALLLSPARMSI